MGSLSDSSWSPKYTPLYKITPSPSPGPLDLHSVQTWAAYPTVAVRLPSSTRCFPPPGPPSGCYQTASVCSVRRVLCMWPGRAVIFGFSMASRVSRGFGK